MVSIQWHGTYPKGELLRSFEAHDVALTRSRHAQVAVLFTAEARPPTVPRVALPWLWVCGAEVGAEAAAEATLAGAYDVISFRSPDALARISRSAHDALVEEPEPPDEGPFAAKSEAARKLRSRLAQAARTSMPVLLTGETGTGKEVSARLLHEWSARSRARFVPINCAAIPNELMEAELFGYSKGAFSGAVQRFDGQLMAAEGGTVFLDEIDDTPLSTQVKLLRVLEDRVVTRLGESEPHRVDFRILAATNRDLKPLIASGHFGADFYERLAIVRIELPPLRERVEDLPELARFFLHRFHQEEPEAKGRPEVKGLSPHALAALAAYPWPGNIRELRNVLFEALVYKRAGDELLLSDLPRKILRRDAAATGEVRRPVVDRAALGSRMEEGGFDLVRETEELERTALAEALRRTGGNAAQAAALLGRVGRGGAQDPGSTVRAMMRRLGITGGRR